MLDTLKHGELSMELCRLERLLSLLLWVVKFFAKAILSYPFRQLHYNKTISGNEPSYFDPQRFLKGKNLRNNPSFKPFGGRVNYCPGRFLVKQEMLVFVALFLYRFEVNVATVDLQGDNKCTPQPFPKLDRFPPALVVNGPIEGSDLYVGLQERKSWRPERCVIDCSCLHLYMEITFGLLSLEIFP